MKLHILYFILIKTLLFCLSASPAGAQSNGGYGVRKVVLDPGHGGKDPGCTYAGYKEKDIVLSIALKLGAMIEENLPDVKVVYTRKTDVFIGLSERGDIANRNKADLFISIHVDATDKGTSASGSSTFVMGLDKTGKNLDVAMRENDVVSYEADYTTKYEGYVPGSAESYIIFSLMQYAYLDQSMNLASLVQKHYNKNTPMKDRGARQGPYLVLWRPAMPSILTETGFLSNPDDRKFLTSKAGQEKVARSLFNAFSEYKSRTEGNSRIITLSDTDGAATTTVNRDAGNSANIRNTESIVREKESAKGGIKFSVQVMASTKKVDPRSRTHFGTFAGKVKERKIGKYYKYYVGEAESFREALSLQREVAKKFKDAFIVAFDKEKPVTITDEMKAK